MLKLVGFLGVEAQEIRNFGIIDSLGTDVEEQNRALRQILFHVLEGDTCNGRVIVTVPLQIRVGTDIGIVMTGMEDGKAD